MNLSRADMLVWMELGIWAFSLMFGWPGWMTMTMMIPSYNTKGPEGKISKFSMKNALRRNDDVEKAICPHLGLFDSFSSSFYGLYLIKIRYTYNNCV